MSLSSSIKLLKLSTSNSHINSRRLSAVINLTANTKQTDEFDQNTTQSSTVCLKNLNNQYKKQEDEKQTDFKSKKSIDDHLVNSSSVSSSTNLLSNNLLSINFSSNLIKSTKKSSTTDSIGNRSFEIKTAFNDQKAKSNTIDTINQTEMGSSNSKCTKITDQQSVLNSCANNGWISAHCHNNLPPPQLNQPYLHHSCSMINLTASDCVCCHSYGHKDATANYNPTVANDLYKKLANENLNNPNNSQTKNCALNYNNHHHCCSLFNPVNKNQHFQNENNYLNERENTKDPYWLQQAKKSNKLARKDQSKFGLFSRNLLNMGLDSSSSPAHKAQYHTYVISGMDLLKEPNLNKDLAFTHKEREKLGIKGLIPPAVRSQELQARIAIEQFRKLDGSLTKYMYLRDLQDFNKRLFYRILIEYVEELMPIVYTPVVGDACIRYSELYKRPRGLFITKHDIGHVHEILDNWPEKDIKAIVVTDGERILGLGDLGANGMGIPVGKLALYSALASIPPHSTLPVTLDVGTNNEKLINSQFYIGLKEPRERGPLYDKLLDEFMEAVVKKWGRTCLIQFEDFGNSNAFKLLQKYRNHYCTFNDDIQGTAAVAVGGILAACKSMKKKISQQKFLFMGAGGAALGISDLLVMAMEADGLTREQAIDNIFLIDSKGLVSKDRQGEKDVHKMNYAKQLPNYQDLEKVVDIVKPSCLIGVCAQPSVFTPNVLRKMAQYNESPVIFPLSNPTSKAECTAEQAYVHTDGKAIFASGSPFDIFKYKNQTFIPGQGNNSYIFPGIALAVMSCGVHTIPEETFLVAARALADQITPEELKEGRIYPCLKKIQQVSVKIATKVAQYFFNQGLSTVRPEPDCKETFIRQHQYIYEYDH